MFIGLTELSAKIGLSKKYLYQLTHKGIIPYIASGGKFYYNPDKVIEALNERAAKKQVDSNEE